jgi:hypothetical protein
MTMLLTFGRNSGNSQQWRTIHGGCGTGRGVAIVQYSPGQIGLRRKPEASPKTRANEQKVR